MSFLLPLTISSFHPALAVETNLSHYLLSAVINLAFCEKVTVLTMIFLVFVCFEKSSEFWSLHCPTIDFIWSKTFPWLLFHAIIIIIISFLEMADLYREDRIDSASREVDLGLGETNCIVQTHKVSYLAPLCKISVSVYLLAPLCKLRR